MMTSAQKRHLICTFAALFCLCQVTAAFANPPINEPPRQPLTRRNFAARLGRLKVGMSRTDALKALGRPELTEPADSGEVWLYGVTPKRHFPTWGTVEFDQTGKVVNFGGRSGDCPPASVISEAELRHMLEIFSSLSPHRSEEGPRGSYDPRSQEGPRDSYDPLDYIRAANALLPEGKKKILAAAREYLQLLKYDIDGSRSAMVLLDAMFDRRVDQPRSAASQLLSASDRPYVAAPKSGYRFPVVLVGDIPLRPYDTYIAGLGDNTEYFEFLQYLDSDCRMRRSPFLPVDNPLQLAEKVQASDQWIFDKGIPAYWLGRVFEEKPQSPSLNVARQRTMCQLLRLVAFHSSHATSLIRQYELSGHDISSEQWRQIRGELSHTRFHWDAATGKYIATGPRI